MLDLQMAPETHRPKNIVAEARAKARDVVLRGARPIGERWPGAEARVCHPATPRR
jgi:hypothetical protein